MISEGDTYRVAIRTAMADAMRADHRVVLLGEDIGAAGGVFKVTEGLVNEFGDDRVRDTPISEQAITGAAFGAAVAGLRPIVELMFADFVAVAMDQLCIEIPKFRYMSGGQVTVPLVVRAVCGAGLGFGAQHSSSPESWFMNTPGWRVVAPSNARDAYELLIHAINCDDPVVFLEHKLLYARRAGVARPVATNPTRATLLAEGSDLTIITISAMVERAVAAADQLRGLGVECDVVDLRVLAPWDVETVMSSVVKTRRLLIVEEGPGICGWGAEVVATVAQEMVGGSIRLRRLTSPPTPVPYSPVLEAAWLPTVDSIVARARELIA